METKDTLVLSVINAEYDASTLTASIKMDHAESNAKHIIQHEGPTITLTYNNKSSGLEDCPHMDIQKNDIDMNIGLTTFFTDKVNINIHNVSADDAKTITDANCLNVDTNLIQGVIRDHCPPFAKFCQ